MRRSRVLVGLLVVLAVLVGAGSLWLHAYRTGPDAFRRDLEDQLDIYGAELQDPLLSSARAYCRLPTADVVARRMLLSPSARREKDPTVFDALDAQIAGYAVHRLCPARTDLRPGA